MVNDGSWWLMMVNHIQLVVWNMFYFSIYWEELSQLTHIFQRDWNQQPELYYILNTGILFYMLLQIIVNSLISLKLVMMVCDYNEL